MPRMVGIHGRSADWLCFLFQSGCLVLIVGILSSWSSRTMFVWLIVHDVRCPPKTSYMHLYVCVYFMYIHVYTYIFCIYRFTQDWVTIKSPRFMILVDQRVSWWFLAFEQDVHVTLWQSPIFIDFSSRLSVCSIQATFGIYPEHATNIFPTKLEVSIGMYHRMMHQHLVKWTCTTHTWIQKVQTMLSCVDVPFESGASHMDHNEGTAWSKLLRSTLRVWSTAFSGTSLRC